MTPTCNHSARLAGTCGPMRIVVDISVDGAVDERQTLLQQKIVSLLKAAAVTAADDAGIKLSLEE